MSAQWTRAYKKAVAEANAEALLEGSDNTETNEGDKAKVKKKRSTLLRRVLNRILERTWYLFLLYSRVYEKDIPLKFLSFLGARHSTTPSNTPDRKTGGM
ncbi:18391_t:CDS:2 [Rhizophagus irregularis]|nr:18391_t:CDS:2 [Rhizophagus irregularis]